MSILQGALAERNLRLTLGGSPSLLVAPEDVTCLFRKSGQNSFSTKVLDNTNWVNLGDGYYCIRFSPNEMNTVGTFIYRLESDEFDNFIFDEFTIEPVPEGIVVPPPDICVVTGFLRNISARPPQNPRIVVRPPEFPARYGQNILHSERVTTVLDYSGQFQLELVRGATVVVEIEGAGIRHQITVPDAPSANLVDLLPPFAIDIV